MRSERLYPVIAGTIVSALMSAELWLLLTVPAAADPFIAFLTVGIIPGTDRRLTLEETYLFIGAASVLVLGIAFHKQVSSMFRRPPALHPGRVNNYIPARYVSIVKLTVPQWKRVEWRKALELDRMIVFAIRHGIRKFVRQVNAARQARRARLVTTRLAYLTSQKSANNG